VGRPRAGAEQAWRIDAHGPVAGVDGYRGGWVAALLAGSNFEVFTARSFSEIAALEARVIAVDIPIGIPEGERPADLAARRAVGPRASSVFATPPRAALETPTFADAVERARAVTGKGIPRQSYGLRHRILEVDSFARTDERIIEVHPEVCFAELAGAPRLASKHTAEGLTERRRLLAEVGIDPPPFPGVPEGDLLDAAAAAWTARRYLRGEATALPADHKTRIGAIWC
jgi:predicted RNase H-like nuclease